MLTFEEIDQDNVKVFERFVFPSNKKMLHTAMAEHIFALGVRVSGVAAGVALASRGDEKGNQWRLHSVYVTAAYRRNGAGTGLLQRLVKSLKDRGCERLHVSYVLDETQATPVNAFFKACGWTEPQRKADVYRWDAGIRECRFIASTVQHGKSPIPEGFCFVSLKDIPAEEKRKIREDSGRIYPVNLSLKVDEDLIDPVCSVAIMRGDSVAGWVLAFKMGFDAILYRSVYVKPAYRELALGIYLLQEAVRRHLESYPTLEALCSIESGNPLMVMLMGRIFENRYKYIKHEYCASLNVGGVTQQSGKWADYVQSAENLESTRKFMLNTDMAALVVAYIGLKPGMKVLDAGCGTGAFTRYMANAAPQAEYCGMDIDASLVATAKKLRELKIKECSMDFIQADALHMPFIDEYFDVVTCHTLFENVPDYEALMREMLRVVKKGGRVAAIASMSPGHQGMWYGDYPQECSFQPGFLALQEKVYYAYMKLCPVGGYMHGLPAVKLPGYFAMRGLKDVSAYPIGRFFSLSNAALSCDEKHEYIEMWLTSEVDKLQSYRVLPGFDSFVSQAECEAYIQLLEGKAAYLLAHIGENCIWEWHGGANILVVGTKG